MEGLGPVRQLLAAFAAGGVAPAQFVQQYAALWEGLRQEQDDAIAAQPELTAALDRLRQQLDNGQIGPEAFGEAVRAEYGLISGLRLPLNGAAADVLDQLYVKADAYRDDPAARGRLNIDADELLSSVREALTVLDGS